MGDNLFWSSVDLTGNQTVATKDCTTEVFWSSVDLTGNQTKIEAQGEADGFGAVSI